MLIGILLGLGAAAAASGSYVFGRLFMVRREGGTPRLLVLAHLVMGAAALAALPTAWLDRPPPVGRYGLALAMTTVFYLSGQVCLLFSLRGIEPSRAAPLLGAKILMLALLTTVFLGRPLETVQWVGVTLAVTGVFILNDAGTRLGAGRIGGVMLACLFYAVSDLSIKRLVGAFQAAGSGPLQSALFGACLVHLACGAAALVLLPWAGRGSRADWRLAAPYGVLWFASLVCLFGAFALIGVIFGAILQSTRGLMSVLLGAALAQAGQADVEQRVAARHVWRRVFGALLMGGAVAAYVWSSRT